MKKNLSLIFVILSLVISAKADFEPIPPHQGPPPPGYSDIYGPPRTVRWQDLGAYQAEKFIDMNLSVDVRDQFVNEIFVAAENNHVEVKQVMAYLSNGQVVEMRNMVGTIQRGRQYRVLLDYRNSLRLQRLVFTIRSPNLAGSRGMFLAQLGLAY